MWSFVLLILFILLLEYKFYIQYNIYVLRYNDELLININNDKIYYFWWQLPHKVMMSRNVIVWQWSRNISSFLITWVVVWLGLNTEDPDQGDQGDDQLHCLLSGAASTTVPKLDWPCWCWCWCEDYQIKSSKRLTHPYYSWYTNHI